MSPLFLSLCALALSLFQSESSEQLTLLQAARVFDPATGTLHHNAAVLVRGDSIVDFGTDLEVPAGAAVIDLGDSTLMPGWIDCHVHLGYELDANSFDRAVRETDLDAAIRATVHASKTLMAGFTTVRNAGSNGFLGVSLARAIDAGVIPGPRVIPAGHALSITGGHGDVTGFAPGILEAGPEQGVADGADAFTKAARYQIKHGAKVIKIMATAGVLSFEDSVGAQQMSAEEMTAVVEEAARHGIRVCAHAHGRDGILAAVRAGVASIEHGSMVDEVIAREMIRRGTWLVPTTALAEMIDTTILPPQLAAKAKAILPLAKDAVSLAISMGVPIAFGTDAAVIPHGQNAKEFAALVSRGMSPAAALQSATISAAQLLDRADLGRLSAGCKADLVAVPGNPLEDITATERPNFVMKGGQVVRG